MLRIIPKLVFVEFSSESIWIKAPASSGHVYFTHTCENIKNK